MSILGILDRLSLRGASKSYLREHLDRVLLIIMFSTALLGFYHYMIGALSLTAINIFYFLTCFMLIKLNISTQKKYAFMQILGYVCVVALMSLTGGFNSPITPFLILLFFTTIFFNRRNIKLVGLIGAVTFATLWVMYAWCDWCTNVVPMQHQANFAYTFYGAEFLFCLVLLLLYQYESSIYEQELKFTREENENTYDQLVKSEKLASLGLITAGIAHEINNPVNFMQMGTVSMSKNIEDLLSLEQKREECLMKLSRLAEAGSPIKPEDISAIVLDVQNTKVVIDYDVVIEELTSSIDTLRNGAHRTSEIVKGLRTYVRDDQSEFEETNLNEQLEATLVVLKRELEDVEVMTELEDIPLVQCRSGRISQVFMNLMSNAIHAAESPAKIRISSRYLALEQSVLIGIQDNGSGINEEDLDRIFEPFYTTKSAGKGTGLGLSISKRIVDNHNGSLHFESDQNGTTFYMKLPVRQNAAIEASGNANKLVLNALVL